MVEECLLAFCIIGGSSVWTYENIALNKTAWQLDTLFNYTSAKAVDGRKDSLSIFGSDCVRSLYNYTAEWRVDLEAVVSIHHIFIQYATNNKRWDKNNGHTSRFLGFSVYISNTTNKEDGILCFRDTNYTIATIPNPTNITCPHHGRYVIYYNNRTHLPYPVGYSKDAGNDLCEVEVYGCTSPGFYGENCSISCPQHCKNKRCHIVEGTCFECDDGYKGSTCSKGCPSVGYYGENCSIPCPVNCLDGLCDIENGTCHGCLDGSSGTTCNEDCILPGYYGENCSTPCPENCVDGLCDNVNGTCSGCRDGYSGPTCTAGESSTTWINNGNSTTLMDVKETKAHYALLFLCGVVAVVAIFVIITIFVTKTGYLNSAKTSHSCCLKTSRENARFSPEDEISVQNFSAQMMRVNSGDHYSNENIYSEAFERTENCREAQSRCSFDDQDNEMDVYSYNHLHEKPIQTCEDVYDVANPIFKSFAPLY